jgi:lysophospholipase L1-like esterase
LKGGIMTRTLLCFGDSNTHGSPPIVVRGVYERHDVATRWPCVVHRALGEDWAVVEEGLPGRTAQFDDPVMGPHMNGQTGLKIELQSHGPIDALTIMLGTNDIKTRFGATPEMVTAGIAGLLDIALGDEMQTRHGGFRVLVICPPPVLEQGPIAGEFFGARATSLALPPLYAALAKARGCAFLDAGQVISVSPVDGIHYDAPTHATLGAAVARAITAMMG